MNSVINQGDEEREVCTQKVEDLGKGVADLHISRSEAREPGSLSMTAGQGYNK